MKNIKYIFLVFILSVSGVSCSDYLDVRPETQILLEEFWQKESDVEAALMACYRSMQEDDFMWRVIIWGELRSDNIMPGGEMKDAERQLNNVNILANNGLCEWNAFYRVINYCNTLLRFAPGVMEKDANFTESDLQVKQAEALAIRAFCYFYLVRTFRDIPLSLEATIDDNQNLQLAQSTPEETLDKITSDLLQAEEWALSGYLTNRESKGRMTKDVIRAILADVYLWKKEYDKCIEYCEKLTNATVLVDNFITGSKDEIPKYELIEEDMSSWDIFYYGNSSESIFELQFTEEKANQAVIDLYGKTDKVGQFLANSEYAEGDKVYAKTDERKSDFIVTQKKNPGEYQIFKYLGTRISIGSSSSSYTFSTSPINWIFYRITDIMLMKAEALVQLQRSEEDLKQALYIVNTTYRRSNPTILEADTFAYNAYNTPVALEKLVLLERQRELMFEGKRWFDLVRHSERKASTEDLVDYIMVKYTSNQSTIASKMSVMNALYLPIHVNELKVNELLKQNPYYQSSSNIEK